ncbi:hypothetical protein SAMN05216198_0116 [Halopseudomonas litoralis]|uniref:Uncharacterized protein n=1 Tax=Halopseudomonas litoralis TaxID=797277 RepID=A0A1H1L747_9GAMM|nr:hypothetical protein [Halopseudomonas litoralis]SDR70237.1 hypothetical protein SAMN05216198_0116 [Halopseudomonas litoralis]
MKFLACDGAWSVGSGAIACDGTLITITSEEIAEEISSPALTPEESQQLIDASLLIFAAVFGFLVLKKLL